jgi:hypothetical protein
MNAVPKTKSGIIRFVADEIASDRPDLAALLYSIKKPGPPRKRNANGFTQHNEHLADIWEELTDRTARGEDEADVQADIGTRKGIKEDSLIDLYLLQGRPEVRAILRARGRI